MSRRAYNDPFSSDPFFRDAFQQDPFDRMNMMMNSMLGGDPFFGAPGFGGHGSMQHPQSRRAHQAGGGGGGGVTIEEVPDHHQNHASVGHGRRRAVPDTPTVEEPDDHHGSTAATHRSRRPHQAPSSSSVAGMFGNSIMPGFPGLGAMPMDGAGGSSFYSYSSSSMSSGGPGGVTYSSTTTHRRGPGGVSEKTHQVYDGRTGQETLQLERGMGDKARTITRTRDASGQEHGTDTLRNMSHEEAEQFDREWTRHAQTTLPGGSRTRRSYGAGAAASQNRLHNHPAYPSIREA